MIHYHNNKSKAESYSPETAERNPNEGARNFLHYPRGSGKAVSLPALRSNTAD